MKLVIADDIKDALEYLALEICDKYEALDPLVTVENISYDLDLEIGEGNFVYISSLDLNGKIKQLDELKKYKRVIYVACGKKYQDLLFRIFTEEKSEELTATYLFDLEDAIIVTDEIGSKKIPEEEK